MTDPTHTPDAEIQLTGKRGKRGLDFIALVVALLGLLAYLVL